MQTLLFLLLCVLGVLVSSDEKLEYTRIINGRWIPKKMVVWTPGVLINITWLSVALSKVAWWFAYMTQNMACRC
ncbi:hypothetical protein B0T26DRAFT_756891 [Lasiosphaeria miniovina]|uniref:Uncharacterized protein n=1 Tax=Lasiosphaeria miniovina TaxID=1954250 RepID=A0AA39ZTD8_9PEZI|nr:uncharacterized protein B0T26DRAFT_756891 [Lasiosphaeria miniovina]KAK0703334.1 hypothetical protein B0T26DRAFT_756891 [Lasiosphaeria miniovina]